MKMNNTEINSNVYSLSQREILHRQNKFGINSTSFTLSDIRSFSVFKNKPLHGGCVNSAGWSEDGSTLVTGSDDLTVKLWRTGGNLEEVSLAHTVRTGHASNIFHARLSPKSGYVLSCAADGTLRHSCIDHVHNSIVLHRSRSIQHMFHIDIDNSNLIYTAEETGHVHRIDIRAPPAAGHSDENYAASSSGSGNSSALLYRRPIGAVKAVIQSPFLGASQLVIGGEAMDVRTFDLRVLEGSSSSRSSNNKRTVASIFYPYAADTTLDGYSGDPSCAPSDASVSGLDVNKDGTKLLVNYQGDYIYIYDLQKRGNLNTYCCDPGSSVNQIVTCPEVVFGGHVNYSTFLKNVAFFGPQDEYVVAGSDSGHAWVWNNPLSSAQAHNNGAKHSLFGDEEAEEMDGTAITNGRRGAGQREEVIPHTYLQTTEDELSAKSWPDYERMMIRNKFECNHPIDQFTRDRFRNRVPATCAATTAGTVAAVAQRNKGNQVQGLENTPVWVSSLYAENQKSNFAGNCKVGTLATIFTADSRTCNGVTPHPFAPVFATYGIDSDVKLWGKRTTSTSSTTTSTSAGNVGRRISEVGFDINQRAVEKGIVSGGGSSSGKNRKGDNKEGNTRGDDSTESEREIELLSFVGNIAGDGPFVRVSLSSSMHCQFSPSLDTKCTELGEPSPGSIDINGDIALLGGASFVVPSGSALSKGAALLEYNLRIGGAGLHPLRGRHNGTSNKIGSVWRAAVCTYVCRQGLYNSKTLLRSWCKRYHYHQVQQGLLQKEQPERLKFRSTHGLLQYNVKEVSERSISSTGTSLADILNSCSEAGSTATHAKTLSLNRSAFVDADDHYKKDQDNCNDTDTDIDIDSNIDNHTESALVLQPAVSHLPIPSMKPLPSPDLADLVPNYESLDVGHYMPSDFVFWILELAPSFVETGPKGDFLSNNESALIGGAAYMFDIPDVERARAIVRMAQAVFAARQFHRQTTYDFCTYVALFGYSCKSTPVAKHMSYVLVVLLWMYATADIAKSNGNTAFKNKHWAVAHYFYCKAFRYVTYIITEIEISEKYRNEWTAEDAEAAAHNLPHTLLDFQDHLYSDYKYSKFTSSSSYSVGGIQEQYTWLAKNGITHYESLCEIHKTAEQLGLFAEPLKGQENDTGSTLDTAVTTPPPPPLPPPTSAVTSASSSDDRDDDRQKCEEEENEEEKDTTQTAEASPAGRGRMMPAGGDEEEEAPPKIQFPSVAAPFVPLPVVPLPVRSDACSMFATTSSSRETAPPAAPAPPPPPATTEVTATKMPNGKEFESMLSTIFNFLTDTVKSTETLKRLYTFQRAVLNNLMVTMMQIGHAKLRDALALGNRAMKLTEEMNLPPDAKLLFRRGCVNLALKRIDDARVDLAAALKLSPTDMSISNKLKEVKRLEDEFKKKEKKAYNKMFS